MSGRYLISNYLYFFLTPIIHFIYNNIIYTISKQYNVTYQKQKHRNSIVLPPLAPKSIVILSSKRKMAARQSAHTECSSPCVFREAVHCFALLNYCYGLSVCFGKCLGWVDKKAWDWMRSSFTKRDNERESSFLLQRQATIDMAWSTFLTIFKEISRKNYNGTLFAKKILRNDLI